MNLELTLQVKLTTEEKQAIQTTIDIVSELFEEDGGNILFNKCKPFLDDDGWSYIAEILGGLLDNSVDCEEGD